MKDLKTQTNISIVTVTALAFLLLFFLIQPCLTQAVKSGEKLSEMKEESAVLETKIKNLQNFKPKYEKEIKPILQSKEDLFIDPQNPVFFISLMEESALQNGLVIDISSAQIFTAQNAPEEPWPSLNFKISLNGTMPEILKFLERMANLPYLVEINGLNIAKESQVQNQDKAKEAASEKNEKENATKILNQEEKARASFNLKVYTK